MRHGARRAAAALLLACTAVAGHARADTKRCIAAAEDGQQQRRAGKLLSARASFVSCMATECPPVVRRDCARWIDELDATTPSIVIKLVDEDGHDAVDGRVLVDGENFTGATTGRAIAIDPGTHHVAWMRPAGDIDEEIVVREGERNRVVVLHPKTTKPVDKPPPLAPPPPPRSTPILPFALGGTGLVLAGAGAVLWGIGLSERSHLQDTCAPAHTCTSSDIQASQAKLVVGDVLVGVGVIAVAVSIYMFARGESPVTVTAVR
ncbi:MAG TPA: hypothetical protein VIF62_03970 [Labilithrix sp.]